MDTERTSDRNETEAGKLSRRSVISRGAAAAAAMTIAPSSLLAAKTKKKPAKAKRPPAPSDKLNIACIGLGACGLADAVRCTGHNIVALCDVDWTLSAVAMRKFPQAAKYRDFRRMLDREKSVDAVIVATPDHTHGVITAEVMKRRKHVYTEMPMAHDVWEVGQLMQIAKTAGVVTQMGNERHSGPTIRRACEMVAGGGLGAIREIHCWTNRPVWPQGDVKIKAAAAPPDDLAWDLWLGPAPKRAYNRAYHPYRWRGWLDFGTGALGAMGCHVMDGPFWAMKLADAETFSVQAESTGLKGGAYPQASTIRYQFPARGDMPPVTITWYDGGRKPAKPKGFPKERGIGSNGSIFVGEKCSMTFGGITAGTLAGQAGPRTIPEFVKITPVKSVKKIPTVPDRYGWKTGARHVQEWLDACCKGVQPCSSFDQAGPLTEMVLLGNVALQAGTKIEWDRKQMKVTNVPAANKFIRREYRKGWSM